MSEADVMFMFWWGKKLNTMQGLYWSVCVGLSSRLPGAAVRAPSWRKAPPSPAWCPIRKEDGDSGLIWRKVLVPVSHTYCSRPFHCCFKLLWSSGGGKRRGLVEVWEGQTFFSLVLPARSSRLDIMRRSNIKKKKKVTTNFIVIELVFQVMDFAALTRHHYRCTLVTPYPP